MCVFLCLCVCRLDVCYSWLSMLRVSRTCPPRMRSLFVPMLRSWFVVCEMCFAKRETCCWRRLPRHHGIACLLMSGASPFVVGVPVDGIRFFRTPVCVNKRKRRRSHHRATPRRRRPPPPPHPGYPPPTFVLRNRRSRRPKSGTKKWNY